MATVLTCDGCGTPTARPDLTTAGRVDPVDYCAACLRVWRGYEQQEEAELRTFAERFEAWRATTKRALGLQAVPGG
jgi:hypothetical protein